MIAIALVMGSALVSYMALVFMVPIWSMVPM
jgi:hypothetical protein